MKSIFNLYEQQANKLAIFQGTVIQTGEIKALVIEQQIQCSQCNQILTTVSNSADLHCLQFPTECDNQVQKTNKPNNFFQMMMNKYNNKKGKIENPKPTIKRAKCGSKKFTLIEGTEHMIDYQEIKIQDSSTDSSSGQRLVRVQLYGNLINSCKAGDTVNVSGIVHQRWLKSNKNQRPLIQLMVDCQQINLRSLQIKSMNEPTQELCINKSSSSDDDQLILDIIFRQKLIDSTCPHVFDNWNLKLAILLCIVGGVSREINQTQIRGNSHILLVGEPGTGKSSILKYVTQMAPKAIYVNGIGSTSAGLTLSYIKEGTNWMIQAGAMVLADQGICCIDEFNLIQKPQLESILEALEQQVVSSSKAGLSTKLNARTTLIAACNPIGSGQKYRQTVDLMENTGLSSPLISRFDLVFILVDEINEEKDLVNSSFILQKYMGEKSEQEQKFVYTQQELQQYLAEVKDAYSPNVSEEGQRILSSYYIKLRQKHNNITVRMLESLIRLTQAHSKLMKRDTSSTFDALSIIILMENTGSQGLGLPRDEYLDSAQKTMELHRLVQQQLDI